MLSALGKYWRELKSSRPGRRFQDRHARTKAAGETHWASRALLIAVAVASFAVGVVLTVMPGPAVVFFFITASILASFSLRVARALDATEVWMRARWRKWRGGAASRQRRVRDAA